MVLSLIVTIVSVKVQIFVFIYLKLFQLPGFKRRTEEVKKRADSEHGKVYLDLRRKKREMERDYGVPNVKMKF